MKKIEPKRHPDHIDDASIVREVPAPRHWIRRALTATAGIALAAALWQSYVLYFKPRQDQQKVDAALIAVNTADKRPAYFEALKAKPREQFLLELFDNLQKPSPELNEQVRIAGARAALDLAISEGSNEARLELGKALRDGVFGVGDSAAALEQFEQVKKSIEPGVKAGDALALYLHAVMLLEGLGVPLDQQAANAAMKRGAERLTGWRLKQVAREAAIGQGAFRDKVDPEMASRLASLAMDAGDHSAYIYGTSSCLVRNRLARADARVNEDMPSGFKSAQARLDAERSANKRFAECSRPWLSRASEAGNRSAMATLADALLYDGLLADARKWYEGAGSERDASQSYNYASIQALTAPDAEALRRSVKAMWLASQEDKKAEFPSLGIEDNWQLAQALAGANKTRERANVVVTMLVQGELAGTTTETADRISFLDSLVEPDSGRVLRRESLSALYESPPIREQARLIYQAISGDKTVAEVQSSRVAAVPAKQSTTKNTAVPREATASNPPDPEQQSRSGRLAGSFRAARGGLSTFAVDNAKGDRDAVVRLYVEGRLPAVRSFYVKLGEKFTETAIAPGTYVMRYRFIGSEDTFEAAEQFVLAESDIASGRRYSKVAVTLFRQANGNLSMKKVAPGQF